MSTPSKARAGFIVTVGLMTAVAALTVDLSLPAIPDMVRALSTGLPQGQLIVGVFMVGLACGQIPAGLFSDRLGRLPVIYVGLILFTTSAVAAAVAPGIDWMLAARFVQGIGAASAIVISRAIVRDIAHGQEAAKLMSLMTMIFTAAPVVAPSIGAILVLTWGWRAPFVVIAICGALMIFTSRIFLYETHQKNSDAHPVRQLLSSFSEFFSHRQSIFGFLLIVLPPAGYISIIAVSSALVVETYGFSVQQFGLIFACAGISILLGSLANRMLLAHFDSARLVGFGIALLAIASGQLLIMVWLDQAPFVWLWGCICTFMFTIPMVAANATVLALDPLPKISGVASSIIGTSQNIVGATGALLAAIIYDGSVRKAVVIMTVAGLLTTLVYLTKPLILPRAFVHHPDELARD